jgi:hypothetical protein
VSLASDIRAALDHWRNRWDEVYGRACDAERKRIMGAVLRAAVSTIRGPQTRGDHIRRRRGA